VVFSLVLAPGDPDPDPDPVLLVVLVVLLGLSASLAAAASTCKIWGKWSLFLGWVLGTLKPKA